MKKVLFQLTQRNGNKVAFEFNALPYGITQDQFAGTYLFPALLRLMKGASMMFDRKLPVHLTFSAEGVEAKVLASLTIPSRSLPNVRKAVLVFNEAIAALVAPTSIMSAYDLPKDSPIFEGKGKDRKYVGRNDWMTRYAHGMLRPSVPLSVALAPSIN